VVASKGLFVWIFALHALVKHDESIFRKLSQCCLNEVACGYKCFFSLGFVCVLFLQFCNSCCIYQSQHSLALIGRSRAVLFIIRLLRSSHIQKCQVFVFFVAMWRRPPSFFRHPLKIWHGFPFHGADNLSHDLPESEPVAHQMVQLNTICHMIGREFHQYDAEQRATCLRVVWANGVCCKQWLQHAVHDSDGVLSPTTWGSQQVHQSRESCFCACQVRH